MDLISDNFISYDNSFTVKLEKLSDPDISLPSPFSVCSESTDICPISIPLPLQNFLNSSSQIVETTPLFTSAIKKKRQPFLIIKTKREEPAEIISLKLEEDEKLASRSKRIMKRAKAKQRSLFKQENIPLASPASSKYTLDGLSEITVDGKSKKKMVQMIRNRISAQNSRDRKKKYVVQLEQVKNQLSEENSSLKKDTMQLQNEINRLKEIQNKMMRENEMMKANKKMVSCENCSENLEKGSLKEENFVFNKSVENKLEGLATLIYSQVPNCNKKLFKDILTFATFISFFFVTNMGNQRHSDFQDLNDISGIRKLFQQAIEKFISSEQQEGKQSTLIDYLNNFFSSQNNFDSNFSQLFQSFLQEKEKTENLFAMDSIKIEECDDFTGTENQAPNVSALFKDLLKAGQNLNNFSSQKLLQDEGLTFFPSNTFEEFSESNNKMNLETENDDLGSFQV